MAQNGETDLSELIARLKDPTPVFELWVREMSVIGKLEGLIRIVGKLVGIDNAADALNWMAEIGKSKEKYEGVAAVDLEGGRYAALSHLNALLGLRDEGDTILFRKLGRLSHRAIPELLTGRLPDYARIQSILSGETVFSELGLSVDRYDKYDRDVCAQILPGNRISDKLYAEIGSFWRKANERFSDVDDWQMNYVKIRDLMPELYRLFRPVFGNFIDELESDSSDLGRCLSFLSALSWTSAFFKVKHGGTRLYFSEVPVLAHSLGLGRKQLDALELETLDGLPPRGFIRDFVKAEIALHQMRRRTSIGLLVRHLISKLGKGLIFKIIDWKFAIGDNNDHLISPSDLIEPFPKHLKQIKEYLALAALDVFAHCFDVGQNDSKKIWNEVTSFIHGQLVYFLPNSPAISFKIKVTPEEQENIFRLNVIARLPEAEQRAILRGLTNHIVGNLTSLAQGKPLRNGSKKTEKNGRLFHDNFVGETIFGLKNFADPETEIIEKIGKSARGDKFILHLDRLLEIAGKEDARVNADFFNPQFGGKFTCPVCQEIESTLRVFLRPDRAAFSCLNCGISGRIAKHSIPKEMQKIEAARSQPESTVNLDTVVVPDEHHDIMVLAQGFLAKCFKEREYMRNPAKQYLERERRIDLDLASQYGAGLGGLEVIQYLLDSNYNFEDLVYYGFITFVSRVKYTALSKLLNGRGYKDSDITLPSDDQKTSLFPTFILQNRVTFPLVLPVKDRDGKFRIRYTGFYGRACGDCDVSFRHRKLEKKDGSVPLGGYNLQVLEGDWPEIIAFEGVMEPLTMLQIGIENSIAFVGAENMLVLEAIIRYGKKIAFALDRDTNKFQTGQRNTKKLMEILATDSRVKGIRDFTADFIEAHPEAADCKDLNEWWVKTGRFQKQLFQ